MFLPEAAAHFSNSSSRLLSPYPSHSMLMTGLVERLSRSALLREQCAGGGLPAGRGINRSGWLLAYRSLSSGSAHCIQSLLRPADWTESGRGVAVQ